MTDIEADLMIANAEIKRLQAQLAVLREDCDITDAANTALHGALQEAERRERAAIDSIVREINQLMEMQMDKEEMYRNRGEKEMEDYAHAKYMGLHDAKCMIVHGDWRGPQESEKGEATCVKK